MDHFWSCHNNTGIQQNIVSSESSIIQQNIHSSKPVEQKVWLQGSKEQDAVHQIGLYESVRQSQILLLPVIITSLKTHFVIDLLCIFEQLTINLSSLSYVLCLSRIHEVRDVIY